MTDKNLDIRIGLEVEGRKDVGDAAKAIEQLGQAAQTAGKTAATGAAGVERLDEAAKDAAGHVDQAAGKLEQLGQATGEVGAAGERGARGIGALDDAAKGAAGQVGQAAAKMGELDRATVGVAQGAQSGAAGIDKLDSAAKGLAGQVGQTAGKLGDLGRTAGDTRTQTAQLVTALEGVQAQAQQAGAGVDKLGKELDDAFRTLGIRAASDVRAEIDKLTTAMARIRATNPFSEDTARAAETLKQRIAQLDAELGRLPEQSTAAAAGMRNVGAASTGAANSIEQATKRAIALAAALVGINSAGQVARSVVDTASAYETLQIRLAQTVGSAEEATEQFERIKKLAIETPFEVSALADSYIKLTNFGLKPSMQQMQTLADTAAVAGGGTEALSRVTTALGQAWAKTALQGDEILQLTEAGVPVWDLLAKATGKNVTELQELSQAGALGRDVILKLFDAMGEKNSGASVKLMSTFAGTISNAKDAMAQFFDMIGKSGVLEYLTKKLQEALKEFDRMKDTGELERKAKAIAQAFVDVAKTAEELVRLLVDLREVIELLAVAWVGAKVMDYAKGLTAVADAARIAAAETKALRAVSVAGAGQTVALGAAAGSAAGQLGAAAAGAGLLSRAVGLVKGLTVGGLVIGVTELAAEFLRARRAALDADEANRKFLEPVPPKGGTRDQVRDINAELQKFKENLPNLGDAISGLTGGSLAETAKATIENLRAIKAPAEEVRKAIGTITERAAEVLGIELPSQAEKLSKGFKGAQAEVQTLLGQLPNLGLTAEQQADVVGQAIAKLIAKATTKKDIEEANKLIELLGKSGKLSGEQVAASFDLSAERARKLSDAIDDANPGLNSLREAARKAGGDFDQLTKGFSEGFRKSLNDLLGFHAGIVDAGVAAERASPQLAAALDQQIRTAKTRKEIEWAREATEEFRASGMLLGVDYAESISKINKKLDELSPTIRQAKKDAEALGIELGAFADKPKKAVPELVAAYERIKASGKASAEEVQQAFVSLAVEAIKANKGIVPEWIALEAQMRKVKVVGAEVGGSAVQWNLEQAGSVGQVVEAVKQAGGAYKEMGAAATAAGKEAVAAAGEAARAAAETRTIVDSMFGVPAAIAARNASVKSTIQSGFGQAGSADPNGRITGTYQIGQLQPPTDDGMWEYSPATQQWVRTLEGKAADEAAGARRRAGNNAAINTAFASAGIDQWSTYGAAGRPLFGSRLPPAVQAQLSWNLGAVSLANGAGGQTPAAQPDTTPQPSALPVVPEALGAQLRDLIDTLKQGVSGQPDQRMQPINLSLDGMVATVFADGSQDAQVVQRLLSQLAFAAARGG